MRLYRMPFWVPSFSRWLRLSVVQAAAAASADGASVAAASAAPAPLFSANAARTRAVREIGDMRRPANWASSTSLLGMEARAFTPSGLSFLPSYTSASHIVPFGAGAPPGTAQFSDLLK